MNLKKEKSIINQICLRSVKQREIERLRNVKFIRIPNAPTLRCIEPVFLFLRLSLKRLKKVGKNLF